MLWLDQLNWRDNILILLQYQSNEATGCIFWSSRLTAGEQRQDATGDKIKCDKKKRYSVVCRKCYTLVAAGALKCNISKPPDSLYMII